MSKNRYAARVDANQTTITDELKQIPGVTVIKGMDDILVGYKGKTYWFEIKNPDTVGRDRQVRPSAIKDSQKELLKSYTGHYSIVWDIDQILKEIGVCL